MLISAFLASASNDALAATVIHVDQSATGVADGSDWGDAFVSLQDALAVASAGDTVLVAEGVYSPGPELDDSFELVDGVAIIGGHAAGGGSGPDNDAHPTVLSGDVAGNDVVPLVDAAAATADRAENNRHVVAGSGLSGVALSELTISGGNAIGTGTLDGGALLLEDAAVTLRNVTFENNYADARGGGLAASNGSTVTIIDSTFEHSIARPGVSTFLASGSAVFVEDSQLTLTQITLRNNSIVSPSDFGPSVGAVGSEVVVESSMFSGNNGGVWVRPGSVADTAQLLEVTDSAFVDTGFAIQLDRDLVSSRPPSILDGLTLDGGSGLSLRSNSNVSNSTFTDVVRPLTMSGQTSHSLDTLSMSNSIGDALFAQGATSVVGQNVTIDSQTTRAVLVDLGASMTLAGSTIADVDAGSRSPVELFGGSSLTLHDSVVADNETTGSGGAFRVDESSLDLLATTVVRNEAGSNGGAVRADDASVRVVSSTLSENVAFASAGITMAGGTLTVLNSVVTRNESATGSALALNGVATDIINSTVSGNATNGSPAGLTLGTSGVTSVINSIVWANGADAGIGFFSGSLTFESSLIDGSGGSGSWDQAFGVDGGNNIDAPPEFVGTDDLRLLPSSPAVDAGATAAVPPDADDVDGDGNVTELAPDRDLDQRVRGAAVDMGAYESVPEIPVGLRLVPLTSPCVIYDSAAGAGELAGPLDGDEIRTVQVTGVLPVAQGTAATTCVPTGAKAVTFTLSAIDPIREGNLRLSASGDIPTGGVVNYVDNGLDNANTVTVPLSGSGRVDLAANGGTFGAGLPSSDARLVAVGYYPDPAAASGGEPPLSYVAVTPCAVTDSRSTQGAAGPFFGPHASGASYPDIDVVGSFPSMQGGGNTTCGVPDDAAGIVANLVAVNPSGGSGALSAAPSPSSPSEPTTPFADLPLNNAAVVVLPLVDGNVSIDVEGELGASVDIRLVVLGYLSDVGADYNPVNPCAAFDSRPNQGAGGSFAGLRSGDQATTYQVSGALPAEQGGGNGGDCGVPSGASAVLVNLVAINAVGEGNLQAFATGTTPTGGVLNFQALDPSMNNANAVVVPLDSAGRLDVRVNGGPVGVGVPLTQIRGVVLGYYE